MSDLPANLFEQQFIRLLARRTGPVEPEAARLLSALCQAAVNQHACIELDSEADVAILAAKPFVGPPGAGCPLVLADRRLYLSRFYEYESAVAAMITARNTPLDVGDTALLGRLLNEKFGTDPGNRQKLAALLAISRRLAIITGGPGTGKTSTVARMLSILQHTDPDIEIRLAAPTGKAAMRLASALGRGEEGPGVVTLHRLLGMRRDGQTWRHGPGNPLNAELLIIDEASMIDLVMMHRLLSALPPHTRLILLGDPGQLPSVETGNVLADICAGDPGFSGAFNAFAAPLVGDLPVAGQAGGLTDAVCELDHSYRFDPASSIARLSLAIRTGEATLSTEDRSVTLAPPLTSADELDPVASWPAFFALLRAGSIDPEALLDAFDQARILCPRRGGPVGVTAINEAVEAYLVQLGLKERDEAFYAGRPVLITRNDYNLSLFNGDIGITVPGDEPGHFLVVFADGRRYLASRLPAHETCFAMTVHKSQGSEFERVMFVLPEEDSDEAGSLLTRELLYTAVTRSRSQVTLHTSPAAWEAAVVRTAARVSGMRQFLFPG